MLNLFQVKGNSMHPALSAGDLVVTRRSKAPVVGDIIVVNDEKVGRIVKRVRSSNNGLVTLGGDNPRLSSSSCDYAHAISSVIGTVVFRFHLPFF
jgi:phage repressor protein C with HTH and peptisase S24 domain